jgi:hypothetical protein
MGVKGGNDVTVTSRRKWAGGGVGDTSQKPKMDLQN